MKTATGNIFIDIWDVIKKTFKRWNEADPFRQSAIIAYYSIFSLPALLVILIAFAGYFFGEEAISGEISTQISGMIGKNAAETIEVMIANAIETDASFWATVIGIGVLLFGATTVFFQLQKSLNRIWGVKATPDKAFLKYLRDRFFSFGLIVAIGFLMLVSLALTSILSILSSWIKARFPDFLLVVFHIINFLVSLGIISVLFALIFKVLPDAIIKWKSVWVGAIVTAFLFVIGKYLLGIYFGEADPGSVYGGAGSIVLILLWVSYVCMVLFLGAEFTLQYSIKFGHGIMPKSNAEIIENLFEDSVFE
jgi:membrane protein